MKRALFLCLLLGCEPQPPVCRSAGLVLEVRSAAADGTKDFERAIALAYERIDEHFRIRLTRVDGIGADLFSAKWKWRSVFWSDGDYDRAVRRLFDRRLYDGIPGLFAAIAADLGAAAEASDNRLMAFVSQRADLAIPDLVLLRREYTEGLAILARQDAELNALSFATGDVAAALVSSVLAAGAATSWWTFGAGLAAAVVAAIAVEAAWGDAMEEAARGRIQCEVLNFRMEALRRIGDAVDAAVIRYLRAREEAIVDALERRIA